MEIEPLYTSEQTAQILQAIQPVTACGVRAFTITSTPHDTPSPSAQDGYNGARDTEILSRATWDIKGRCFVQCTPRNYDLLKRAGIKRQTRFKFYWVNVRSNPVTGNLELA